MADTRTGETASVPEENAAIRIDNLAVNYGRKRAVDDLSMTVPRGSVYGFLGPNGAGKTSTIKTLMGFRKPNDGSAKVLGYHIVDESLGGSRRPHKGLERATNGTISGLR